MKNFSIVPVYPGVISEKLLSSWAKIYCEIWKEPPWNEDFWKLEEVSLELSSEMLNPDAMAFVALVDEEVIGFTHGYSVSCDELRVIAGNHLLDYLFKKERRIYYVDELGVASSYRGLGISKQLTSLLINHARLCNVSGVILRTDVKAVSARALYEKVGFKELPVFDESYSSRTYWFLDFVL